MTDHIKRAFFDPEKAWVPVTMVYGIFVIVITATIFIARLQFRLEAIESLGFSEEKISRIVETAINKSFPALILQLDERYQKKNDKVSVRM